MNVEREIADFLKAGGAGPVGFADLTALPPAVRHDLPRAVAFAVPLDPEVVAAIGDGPTAEYVAEYRRVNVLLAQLSRAVADLLTARGYAALGSAATDEDVDRETQSTPLPHKTVATLAGLGWIGKCALLVGEEYGAAVRLNRVLSDAPLPVGRPVTESRCGACRACADACPGAAANGEDWSPGRPRADFFDAFACRRAANEIAMRRTGVDESLCGICIAVCPWTQRSVARTRGRTGPPAGPGVRDESTDRPESNQR